MARMELGTSDEYSNITPSDTTNMTVTGRAFWIGSGGDVNIARPIDGQSFIFRNVPSGYLLPVSAIRVNATNTTASNIVVLP
jgi:hypothetical protein